MSDINLLISLLDTLLGPNGCPWDQKQTLLSIKTDLLEETCEVIDAIDLQSKEDIKEELGDLLFVILFLCRLAEKEKFANLNEITSAICEKLIRRHPHIFKEKKHLSDQELLIQWDEIKSQENNKTRHPFDRIPNSLPALSKCVETLHAIKKHNFEKPILSSIDLEMQMGQALFSMVETAVQQKIDPEFALRKFLAAYTSRIKNHLL